MSEARKTVIRPSPETRRDSLSFVLLAVLLVSGCTADAPPSPVFEPRSHFLAEGRVAEGRAAFIDLKCTVCHTVVGEDFTVQVPNAAPMLGNAEGSRSPEVIAGFIATPSHTISAKPGPWKERSQSQMGNYADVMTLQQLADIVAYIRSLSSRNRIPESRERESL